MEETSKQNDTQQSIKKKEHYLDIEGINSSLISLEDIKRQLYTKSYES